MSNYSSRTIELADRIILNHHKYDRYSKSYFYDFNNITDVELARLSASFMADDKDSACEAISLDNPRFPNHMLSSLISFMRDTSDSSNAYDFLHQWQDGIVSYFSTSMRKLLDERMETYMFYEKYEGDAA